MANEIKKATFSPNTNIVSVQKTKMVDSGEKILMIFLNYHKTTCLLSLLWIKLAIFSAIRHKKFDLKKIFRHNTVDSL